MWDFQGNMVGKWTNEPCSEVDEVVNHFWVLTHNQIIVAVDYFMNWEEVEARLIIREDKMGATEDQALTIQRRSLKR